MASGGKLGETKPSRPCVSDLTARLPRSRLSLKKIATSESSSCAGSGWGRGRRSAAPHALRRERATRLRREHDGGDEVTARVVERLAHRDDRSCEDDRLAEALEHE
eukprot:6362726-Prymnesium_polylepis.1